MDSAILNHTQPIAPAPTPNPTPPPPTHAPRYLDSKKSAYKEHLVLTSCSTNITPGHNENGEILLRYLILSWMQTLKKLTRSGGTRITPSTFGNGALHQTVMTLLKLLPPSAGDPSGLEISQAEQSASKYFENKLSTASPFIASIPSLPNDACGCQLGWIGWLDF